MPQRSSHATTSHGRESLLRYVLYTHNSNSNSNPNSKHHINCPSVLLLELRLPTIQYQQL